MVHANRIQQISIVEMQVSWNTELWFSNNCLQILHMNLLMAYIA
jgi:hypothetical protein